MQDKLKILYISPHLSTGGLPQYLWKKIEAFNDVGEVYCVEYDYLGDAYVVQIEQQPHQQQLILQEIGVQVL